MFKLTFKIAKDLLFLNTVIKGGRRISKEWVDLQNRLWEKYEGGYSLVKNDGIFLATDNRDLETASKEIVKLVKEGESSEEFKIVVKETKDYLNFIEKEWGRKGKSAQEILESILKTKLPDQELTVYITHPKVSNGRYLGGNAIVWGHTEDWPNYSVVYLLHEALHSLLKKDSFVHEAIELATDNELRIRLNGHKEYFMEGGKEVGNPNLLNTERKILPMWRDYLANENQNIFQFLVSLKEKDPPK